MKTYLDTSAVVKLVVAEEESTALRSHLQDAARADTLFTAALTRTEHVRAVAGSGPVAIAHARAVLAELDTVNLTRRLLDAAGTVQPAQLRSLDAIHLAAAQTAGSELREVLSYDNRILQVAAALGMTVASPGR